MSHVAALELPLPARLRVLARDLGRLQTSRTDLEGYHVAKSEIVRRDRLGATDQSFLRILYCRGLPPLPAPRAAQSRRHRLRLPTGDLFAWAERR